MCFKTLAIGGLVLVFLFSQIALTGQNLVPNYSFEITPCDGPQAMQEYIYSTPPWYSPNGQTSDIYNSCKTLSWVQTPNAPFGYQVPANGGGYAGIRLFLDPRFPNYPDHHNYREYLAVQLTEPLEKDKIYYVSFKVSVGEAADFTTDDIGLYLSPDPMPNIQVLLFDPQIRNPEGNILTNTTDWITISGNYKAKGGEQHIAIGNFYDDEHTTIVPKSSSITDYHTYTSYFYVDEVVVEYCGEAFTYQQPLPKDTLLCSGERLTLDVNTPNGEYRWDDGSRTSSITIDSPGLYSVVINVGNCVTSDSSLVRYVSPIKSPLPKETILCNDQSFLLDATVSSASYLWSDGSTNPTRLVNSGGDYSVAITLDNCSVVETAHVEQGNCTFLIPNVITPNGDEKNDTFFIQRDFRVETRLALKIYSRWGELVYESPDYHNDWDGQGLSTGVYYYKFQHLTTEQVYTGQVTILR